VESKQAIADRLELTRRALGYDKQSTFCEALGKRVTPQRWNNYESGRDRLTLNVALLICRKFQMVTLDWLSAATKAACARPFRPSSMTPTRGERSCVASRSMATTVSRKSRDHSVQRQGRVAH